MEGRYIIGLGVHYIWRASGSAKSPLQIYENTLLLYKKLWTVDFADCRLLERPF